MAVLVGADGSDAIVLALSDSVPGVLYGGAIATGPVRTMRFFLTSGLIALFLVPSAAQAQSSALPRTGYDKSWYISEFWSGETPQGFAITRKNVTVMARSGMNKKLPRAVACRLPYLAVFHPWNKARNRKNHARYFSATKIVNLIAKEDFEYQFGPFESRPEDASREAKLVIKNGDVIQYLQYGQEGAFVVRLKGKKLVAHSDLFDHVQDGLRDRFLKNKFPEDEWVSLTCQNGARAYIYFQDVYPAPTVKVPGVNVPGLQAIGDGGDARDITVREAEQIEKDSSTR